MVKVDKFIFLADFVVLDMEEDEDIPIILGRPFLATGGALIEVQRGELKLRVQGDEVTFNVLNALKCPNDQDHCYSIATVEESCSHLDHLKLDALETVLHGIDDEYEI